ncbi:MAG: N-acetylmuramoyl-L-alanine amidase [Verrucomicrobia bacterium]|nr:N-acetylmuramoyl-L-alanine amidase [Verrucomicrobiota bacterium]
MLCSEKNPRAAESRAVAIELGSAMLKAGFKPTTHYHEAIPGENRPWIDQPTGVYEYTDLVVAKSGKLPSVLLECGVIVNRDDELLGQTKEYQQRIAGAVTAALASAKVKELIGTAAPVPAATGGSLLDVTATPPKPEPDGKRKGLLPRK